MFGALLVVSVLALLLGPESTVPNVNMGIERSRMIAAAALLAVAITAQLAMAPSDPRASQE